MSASVTSVPGSHTALRTLLMILTIVMALAGLALLFATGWLEGMLSAPAGFSGEMSTFLLQGIGAVVLGMSYLAFSASRDPVRYVGIVDAFIITLVVVVALEIYEIVTGAADRLLPYHLIVWSTIVRGLLAVVLIWLRPRGQAISA